MINVLKRLAELDAKNPRIVKEEVDPGLVQDLANKLSSGEISYEEFKDKLEDAEMTDDSMRQGEMGMYSGDTPAGHRAWDREKSDWDDLDGSEQERDDLDEEGSEEVDECGDMMSSSYQPKTPASISITAGSGEELGSMLKTIMTLAGVSQHDAEEPAISAEPAPAEPERDVDSTQSMRSVIDKLNPSDDEDEEDSEEEMDETVDSLAADPNDYDMHDDALLKKGMHNRDPAGHPQKGDRMDGVMPKANATTFESLMKEYKEFVKEEQDKSKK